MTIKFTDLSKRLNESKEDTVVFAFGRFNPPTVGHAKLFKKVEDEGRKAKDHFVFGSHSQDAKKNPLEPKFKQKVLSKAFPHNNVRISSKDAPTALHIASMLYAKGGYKNLVMVAGQDRITEFKNLLDKYNNVQGRHGFYNFDNITVVSSGDRDADADDDTGASGTKMRMYAAKGDYESFRKYSPVNLPDRDVKAVFNAVRKVVPKLEGREFASDPIREAYLLGDIFNEGDVVIDIKENKEYTIIERGPNFVYCKGADDNVYTKWLSDIKQYEDFELLPVNEESATGATSSTPAIYYKGFKSFLEGREVDRAREKNAIEIDRLQAKHRERIRDVQDREEREQDRLDYLAKQERERERKIAQSQKEEVEFALPDYPVQTDASKDDGEWISGDPGKPITIDGSTEDEIAKASADIKKQRGVKEDTGSVKHHQFQQNLRHAQYHARVHKDLDVDGDVDALDKITPDEVTGTEKQNQTAKMFKKYEKEKQHTKKGVAFESFSEFTEGLKQDKDIKDKEGTQPAKYYTGLSKSTKDDRDAHFKSNAKKADDDKSAYKPAPGDKSSETKPSKYTKKYQQMYGEEIEGLRKKAEKSGISYATLKKVYDRGMAAWKGGHRPGTTPQQWAFARVNSYITKGKTYHTADSDLHEEITEDWFTVALSRVTKAGGYRQAKKLLQQVLDRKRKEGGLNHDISWYAWQIGKQFPGVDVRTLTKMVEDFDDEWNTDLLFEEDDIETISDEELEKQIEDEIDQEADDADELEDFADLYPEGEDDEDDDEDEEDSEDVTENYIWESIEEDQANEVLTPQQRFKRAQVLRRNKAKTARARKIALRRVSSPKVLQKRARKHAINTIRKRFTKGKPYSELGVAQKAQIDKFVATKKAMISRLAKRLMPTLRKLELKRLRSQNKTAPAKPINKPVKSESVMYTSALIEENIFRVGSEMYFHFFQEAKEQFKNGTLVVEGFDKQLLESDIGEFAEYEGEHVPLDCPMILDESDTLKLELSGILIHKGYVFRDAGKSGRSTYGRYSIKDPKFVPPESEKRLGRRFRQDGTLLFDTLADVKKWVKTQPKKSQMEIDAVNKKFQEREDSYNEETEKQPELNKPKRGGPKKYYVYVKDPSTGNIKKVTFGDTTGLTAKINDPEARKSFVARHKCDIQKDKTSAAYWACRLPYYAKQLGLSGGGSFFW